MSAMLQEAKKVQRLMYLSRCRLELLNILKQKNKLKDYDKLVEQLMDILITTETLTNKIRTTNRYTSQEQSRYKQLLKANRKFSLLFRESYKGYTS